MDELTIRTDGLDSEAAAAADDRVRYMAAALIEDRVSAIRERGVGAQHEIYGLRLGADYGQPCDVLLTIESERYLSDRILTQDMAYAVGRFDPSGVAGYRAATMPDAPLRPTRAEAIEDEARYLDERCGHDCPACAEYETCPEAPRDLERCDFCGAWVYPDVRVAGAGVDMICPQCGTAYGLTDIITPAREYELAQEVIHTHASMSALAICGY